MKSEARKRYFHFPHILCCSFYELPMLFQRGIFICPLQVAVLGTTSSVVAFTSNQRGISKWPHQVAVLGTLSVVAFMSNKRGTIIRPHQVGTLAVVAFMSNQQLQYLHTNNNIFSCFVETSRTVILYPYEVSKCALTEIIK